MSNKGYEARAAFDAGRRAWVLHGDEYGNPPKFGPIDLANDEFVGVLPAKNLPTLAGGLTIEELDGSPTAACTKLVLPNGTTSIVGGVATYTAAASGISWNSQSAAYTAVLADTGIRHPAADTTPRIWTIPANASVAFPIGTELVFDNEFGAGTLTIAITTDTLLLVGIAGGTGSRTLASGGQAYAEKVTATTWRISGIGLS